MNDLTPRPGLETQARPAWKDLVLEAARALARLDSDRLEELVLCCQALNRDLLPIKEEDRARLSLEAREARDGMAVFARVLEAARANAQVMQRLRELRAGRLEYASVSRPFTAAESRHGND